MNFVHRLALRGVVVAFVLLFVLVAPAAAQRLPQGSSSGRPAVQGYNQFVVRFKPGTKERGQASARQAMLEELGRGHGLKLSWMRRMAFDGDVIRADRRLGRHEAAVLLRRLLDDPRVELAHADQRVYAANTNQWQQWHLGDFHSGIRARYTWGRTTGNGVRIAVLDTGITPHPDLDDQWDQGYDFVSHFLSAGDGNGRDPDPSDPGDFLVADICEGERSYPTDSSWHGTKVAGLVAAAANGQYGVGVAYGAKLVPVRVLGKCGGMSSDIADAILWAAGVAVEGVPLNPDPVEVINLSLGGPGRCDATTQQAIDTAVARGTTIVVAAGNDGIDAAGSFPANCENVIAVGAVSVYGWRAGYSNFGAKVDLVAPGSDWWDWGGYWVHTVSNDGTTMPGAPTFGEVVGTSFAAPHVAGTVALMQSVTVRSPAEVERILKATARSSAGSGWPCLRGCGAGLVDAARAVSSDTPDLYFTNPLNVTETNGSKLLPFTIALTDRLDHDVTFHVATKDGDAKSGSDYAALSQDGVIPAGELAATFHVFVLGDAAYELYEAFQIETTNVVGAVMRDPVATVFIKNDDGPVLTVRPVAGVEGKGLVFKATFAQPMAEGFGFSARVLSRLDGYQDYYAHEFNPVIKGGELSTTFTLDLHADDVAEPTESFDVLIGTEGFYWFATTGTILGDDPTQYVNVDSVAIPEGNGGAARVARFTAMLTYPALAPVTVSLRTQGVSAEAGVDFVDTAATLTIPVGMTTATFDVPLLGDTAAESNETFVVNITGVSSAQTDGANDFGVGTILSDDTPLLTVTDATVVEGSGGARLAFQVQLSQAAPTAVTYTIATSAGTATAGSDYASRSIAEAIPAGATRRTFFVDVVGDAAIEPNELLTVDVSAVAGATVLDGHAVGEIVNDDGAVLSLGDAVTTEGNAGTKQLTFTATLSTVAPGQVTFTAATADDTATAGEDYVAATLTGLTIPQGQLSKAFSVTILGDTQLEPDEHFAVTLGTASGASIGDGSALATITRDDRPTIAIADADVVEGHVGTKSAAFAISLSAPAPFPVTFDVASATAGTASAGVDYTPFGLSGQVIPAGATSRRFEVPIVGDTTIESAETFVVRLANVIDAAIGDGAALGTIANDDLPTMSIADVTVAEGPDGSKQAVFTVSLSQAVPFAVGYSIGTTGSGTATAGLDYFAANASAQLIPAGQVSRTFAVTVLGESTIEPDETFVVALSAVTNASLADGTALGTIANDDWPGLSIADVAVAEGNSGEKLAAFTVTLSRASIHPVTFNAATTGAGTGVLGGDYTSMSHSGLTVPAGALTRSFNVTLYGDSVIENDETFVVAISNVTRATVTDGAALGTIVNDDKPLLTIADVSISEGHAGTKQATFTVALSQAAPYAVTFNAATTGAGTATAGTDYVALASTPFSIPAGQTARTVAVTLKGDTTVEPNETYVVAISNVVGANVGDGTALGTIANDD
jgi:subtilisin family serine protease